MPLALAAVAAGAALAARVPAHSPAPGAAPPAAWAETARLSGPSPGLIADLALGPAGEAYVLDAGQSNVHVYGVDGAPRQRLGRRGRGPGEFAGPVALAAGPGGRLYVLDEMEQRVEVFRLPGGTREGGLRLPFTGRDLCTLGARLFVLGEMDGRLIHEVSPADGRVLRSFAPDPARDPMLSVDRTGGLLACRPDGVVTYLPALRGEVSWYSASTGERLGGAEIPGYVPVEVRRYGDGVLFQQPATGRHHAGASMVVLDDGRQLVQTGVPVQGATRYELDEIRSFVVSRRDGTVTELGGGLPRLLAVHGGRAFAAVDDPEPRVVVLRPSLSAEAP